MRIVRRQTDPLPGCGLTVHSRASDLRKLGHRVSHWTDGQRGNGSWYRISLEQATADTTPSPAAVASSSEQLVLTGAPFRRTAA